MTVTAADHDITIQLIHHLMDCLTEQVREGEGEGEGEGEKEGH